MRELRIKVDDNLAAEIETFCRENDNDLAKFMEICLETGFRDILWMRSQETSDEAGLRGELLALASQLSASGIRILSCSRAIGSMQCVKARCNRQLRCSDKSLNVKVVNDACRCNYEPRRNNCQF